MRSKRLKHLLAMEIARIVDDLELREEFLLRMWSKHRDRRPFLDSVFNRWKTVGFPDLVDLEPEQVAACDAFFRKVDEFRLYVAYTQDMPITMTERYRFMVVRLRAWAEQAIDLLGVVPEQLSVLDEETRDGFLLAFPEGSGNDEGGGETMTEPGPSEE